MGKVWSVWNTKTRILSLTLIGAGFREVVLRGGGCRAPPLLKSSIMSLLKVLRAKTSLLSENIAQY